MLDKSEFKKLLREFNFDEKEIEFVTSSVDLNQDGQIEITEFVNACTQIEQSNMVMKSQIIFDLIDIDNSGMIDLKEFE